MTCSMDDCAAVVIARGLCFKHYQRQRRHGDPNIVLASREVVECAIESCERRARCQGWCLLHYQRWRSNGTTDKSRPGRRRMLVPTYAAIHGRLRQDRGSASGLSCVDCHAPALHWSYLTGCPDEQRGPNGNQKPRELTFCPHLEHYVARCAKCHVAFDRGGARV